MPPGNLPYFLPNNNAPRGQTSKIVSNTFFPGCQALSLRPLSFKNKQDVQLMTGSRLVYSCQGIR